MSNSTETPLELSVRLSPALFEQLKTRAKLLGRPVELEARTLFACGIGDRITVHDELLALAERWVRRYLGIENQSTVEMIRADRDGIPDAERFEELAGRYRPFVDGWRPTADDSP